MNNRTARVTVAGAVFLLGLLAGAVLTPNRSNRSSGTAGADNSVTEFDTASGGDAENERSKPPTLTAEEAALDYATASQQWLYLTDEQIDRAVRRIALPAAADRLSEETVAELSVARDALAHAAGPIWWFVRPLATSVTTLTDTRAEVSVWVVTVLSAADVAVPQADWVTLDLALVRDGERWLLESITDTVGPTPMSGVRDQPWQPEPFDDALAGFERIGFDQ